MNDFWDEDKVETLKKLFYAGHSHDQISKALSCSRGSIAGKIERLDLKRTSHNPSHRPKPILETLSAPVKVENLKPLMIPLEQIGFMQCRYPMWGDGDPEYIFPCCGLPCKEFVNVYCDEHKKITKSKRS